ncbi:hypothetical protein LAG90_14265 [Marinilongibacter aquaticus]|uniref:hypothetical protein n=1 Tax=Marinilongibacter aquaticus TaxID=2975157 RepID=UPI0021BD8373|nr:hypothetical protein [Marinilongibacter aquaticus]UBM57970.1 hypothetical protein LAG90_14265 [Marinilongibacter aquaticus]
MDKTKHIEKTIAWAKKNGFDNIKADLEGYEQPFAYERAADQQKFVPDVTGVSYSKKCFFEVVLKAMDGQRNTTKLTLLNELAKIKNSRLYLMAPTGNLKYTKELVDSAQLTQAEVVRI